MKYGCGNWQKIIDDPEISLKFVSRSAVDLKDKNRNWDRVLKREDLREIAVTSTGMVNF